MKDSYSHRLYRAFTIIILMILIGVNVYWFVFSRKSGSLVAVFFYLIILFLCWRMADYRAVITAGVVGFGFHLFELIFLGISDFQGLELLFFYLNLVLPIPLAYFGYRVLREGR